MTIKIRMTDAADSFKVIRASGVLVEQKSVRPNLLAFCSRWSAKKEDIKRDCKQLKKREMEPVKTKTKQAGRPAKIIKKEIRAAVRFSKTEHFIIRQKAAKAGMKVSAYVRQIAINGAVIPKLSEEERHFVRQLIGMSNNINQLTKNSHTEGMLKTMLYFETCRNQFEVLLKKLSHG